MSDEESYEYWKSVRNGIIVGFIREVEEEAEKGQYYAAMERVAKRMGIDYLLWGKTSTEKIEQRQLRIGEAFTQIAINLQEQKRTVDNLTLEEMKQLFQKCWDISKERQQ